MSVFTKTINFSSHTGFILYSYSLLVWLHIRLNSWDSAKILRCLVIWFFSAALRPAFTTPRSVHWWHLPLTLGTKRHLKCMKLPSSKCMWGPLCSRQLNQDSSHCKDVSCTIHTQTKYPNHLPTVPKHQGTNLTKGSVVIVARGTNVSLSDRWGRAYRIAFHVGRPPDLPRAIHVCLHKQRGCLLLLPE